MVTESSDSQSRVLPYTRTHRCPPKTQLQLGKVLKSQRQRDLFNAFQGFCGVTHIEVGNSHHDFHSFHGFVENDLLNFTGVLVEQMPLSDQHVETDRSDVTVINAEVCD